MSELSQAERTARENAKLPGERHLPGRRVLEEDGRTGNMVVASAYTRQQAIIDALKILQNRTVGSPEACERAIDVLTAGLAAEENARRFFTVASLAAYLDLSERTITDWLRDGILPSYKIGGARRIDPTDVDAYLAQHRQEKAA